VVILTYTPLIAPPEQPISGFARTYIDWGYRNASLLPLPSGSDPRHRRRAHLRPANSAPTSAIDGPVGTSSGRFTTGGRSSATRTPLATTSPCANVSKLTPTNSPPPSTNNRRRRIRSKKFVSCRIPSRRDTAQSQGQLGCRIRWPPILACQPTCKVTIITVTDQAFPRCSLSVVDCRATRPGN